MLNGAAIVHPRDFDAEYVLPAVETWVANCDAPHLAVHAITQFDVLAEVTALWTLLNGRERLGRSEARDFRDEQGRREPALAVVRDVHDCHKHGRLSRAGNVMVSRGQRPEMATHYGFFCGRTFCGGPATAYGALSIQLDSGRPIKVLDIINDARAAWTREYGRARL